ncbi:MAG: phosphatidylglycerophosphatase A [Labilithrix sp.]|nr:phosphatidylglycerophosphatase A [Labilithrix sp.]MCW5832685.1 phosphatidylglycerophosphatase A [Labilithrix sp.]
MSAPPPTSSLEARLARVLATWFGCGLSPVAPGTVGTLGALPLWYAVRGGGALFVLAVAGVVTLVGVWAAGVVAHDCGAKDPQLVVIDEVAGVLFALAAAPPTTRGTIAAVVSFRVFDMTKPFPARRAEKLPGGWGIVLDDVVAGVQAAAVVRLLEALGALA